MAEPRMSAGSSDEKCAEVLEQVYAFIDQEIDETDRRRVQEHLDECGPCLARYDLERLVKQVVHRSCSHEHAPGALRERVLTRIRAVQISITEQQ